MRSSWSRVNRRRALTGATVAALGTVLIVAPLASAADNTPAAQGAATAVTQQAATATQQAAAATQQAAAATQQAGDNDSGMLGGDHEFKFWLNDKSTVIICEFCQVAQGDIFNAEKITIKKEEKKEEKKDEKKDEEKGDMSDAGAMAAR